MKMKHSILFAACLLILGCTNDFDKINTDRDATSQVDARFLMAEAQVETLRLLERMDQTQTYISSHYFRPMGGPAVTLDEAASTPLWNLMYVEVLKPLQDIFNQFEGNESYYNRLRMTDIWQSFVWSIGVSSWGPLPYFDALKGEELTDYDSEGDIYLDLLIRLRVATSELSSTQSTDVFSASHDFVFGSKWGSPTERIGIWRKFGNSLRLRIVSQIYNVRGRLSPELQTEILNTIDELLSDQSSMLSSNSDNINWDYFDGTEDEVNPIYNDVFVDPFTPGQVHCTEMLISFLKAHDDPRLFQYASVSDANGVFEGRPLNAQLLPQGLTASEETDLIANNPHQGRSNYGEYSKPNVKIGDDYRIFHYDEVLFLLAELSFLKADIPTAESLYLAGVEAALSKLNGLDPAVIPFYLSTSGIAVNTSTPLAKIQENQNWLIEYLPSSKSFSPEVTSDLYEKIVLQRWLASYPQCYDIWPYLKRTDFVGVNKPVLYSPAPTNPNRENAKMPNRFTYPDLEYVLNPDGFSQGLKFLGVSGVQDTQYEDLLYIP